MGPPKKKPKKTSYDEMRRRYDCFEHRWNSDSLSYYLFNPWTGETIFNTDLTMLDRAKSMWTTPDRFPSDRARNTMLYPEFYASRRWGRRRFYGWKDEESAATHIAAVARGLIARQSLRRYYRLRYHTKVDNFSGYFFFVDNQHPHDDTSWYKPRLAFPDDILPLDENDPEDYMKGKKYSRQDFTYGPLLKVAGLNKKIKGRTQLEAFHVESAWRDAAISDYEDINLNTCSRDSIIAWMDGSKASKLNMSAFHIMRAALAANDGWATVIKYMKEYPKDNVIQIYGYHSFSKTSLPLHHVTGQLDLNGISAMYMCVNAIKDEQNNLPLLLKLFAVEAFYNVLSARPGRLEYLNTTLVLEQGELRQAAVERFYHSRLCIFGRYLVSIPFEVIDVYAKGANIPEKVQRPQPRSVDLVEAVIKCLCMIAHESETKEQLAVLIVRPLLHALETCKEDACVILHGLQLMYNLCYRCESGQEVILTYCDTEAFFQRVSEEHSGDPDVMHQSKRLHLALQERGWQGGVELILTRELKQQLLQAERMQKEYSGVNGIDGIAEEINHDDDDISVDEDGFYYREPKKQEDGDNDENNGRKTKVR